MSTFPLAVQAMLEQVSELESLAFEVAEKYRLAESKIAAAKATSESSYGRSVAEGLPQEALEARKAFWTAMVKEVEDAAMIEVQQARTKREKVMTEIDIGLVTLIEDAFARYMKKVPVVTVPDESQVLQETPPPGLMPEDRCNWAMMRTESRKHFMEKLQLEPLEANPATQPESLLMEPQQPATEVQAMPEPADPTAQPVAEVHQGEPQPAESNPQPINLQPSIEAQQSTQPSPSASKPEVEGPPATEAQLTLPSAQSKSTAPLPPATADHPASATAQAPIAVGGDHEKACVKPFY